MRSGKPSCAFCREPTPESEKDFLAQLVKRVELNDPTALLNMALHYGDGKFGLPVDHAKCIDLLRQSVGLGYPDAQYQLGTYHQFGDMGLERNEEEALKYWRKAAEGGEVYSRHYLGCAEYENGDDVAAMRHWRLSASGGFILPMKCLIASFEDGLLYHGDLAETLHAMYVARTEMRSDDRSQYIRLKKMAGEYEEGYEY
jgi:TPR repeat protein